MDGLLPLTVRNIAWLAGIVEGEGCITWGRSDSKYPGKANSIRLHVGMSDCDVIDRVARLLGTRALGPYAASKKQQDNCPRKVQWRAIVTQDLAASWLMTLYPLLGDRRRAMVRETLAWWRAYPVNGRMLIAHRLGHPLYGARHARPWTLPR